jgi:hypothetical protein
MDEYRNALGRLSQNIIYNNPYSEYRQNLYNNNYQINQDSYNQLRSDVQKYYNR